MVAALVLITFTWIARPDAPTVGAALWAGFFGAMLIGAILGGGILAQDFDSGSMALQRLHGAREAEVALAAFLSLVAFTFAGFAAWACAVLVAVPGAVSPVAVPLLACLLGLAAWGALLVLGGSILPGWGNVAAAMGLVLFGSADDFGNVPVVSAAFTFLRDVLPLPRQAIEIFRSAEAGAPIAGDVVLLVGGSAALIAATLLVLRWREPASGWRR